MELKKIVKNYNKTILYLNYCYLTKHPKDYEKITKYQMVLDVYKQYIENPKFIVDVCSFEELMFLKKMLNKKVKVNDYYNYKELEIFRSIKYKYLASFDHDNEYFLVPPELEKTIKKALQNLDEEELKKRDEVNNLLIGLIRAYYSFDLDILYEYFSEHHNMSYIDFKEYLVNTIYLKKYIYLKGSEEYEFLCFSEEYLENIDEINDNYNENSQYFNYRFPKEHLISIAKNKINLEEPDIMKFYNYLLETVGELCFVKKIVEKFINLAGVSNHNSIGKIINMISKYGNFDLDLDEANNILNIIMDAYNKMPNWVNGGVPSFYAAEQMLEEKSKNPAPFQTEKAIKIGRNEPCPCGSGKKYKKCCLNEKDLIRKGAVITYEDSLLFYKLYTSLMAFTNQKYKIIKDVNSAKDFINSNGTVKADYSVKIREKMWEDENIIKEFLEITDLPNEEAEIVKSWKKRITECFVLYKYESGLAILISNNNIIYGVAGISNPISENIPAHNLPAFVELTLLPFKDKIIYDSILQTYNISMKDGIKKIFNDTYEKLKDEIITKL
ncbi:MAG: SEC-C metal-binding domain-containing protein [Bacilli bacterium]|nr:SEC-C metal-binding domain-containing protein [Bacilli bacterium]